jgi:DNA-binding NarL/FixJ family response regulator
VAHTGGDDTIQDIRPEVRLRLTEREQAVLAASATGLTVAEVATALDLTPETVRAALGSTIAKLGARSKLEAVVIAFNAELVGPPGL